MNDIEMNNDNNNSENEINYIKLEYKENNIEKDKINNNKSFINWILCYFNIDFM